MDRWWRVWARELTDLVWPRTCAGCARAGVLLCPRCTGADTPALLDDLTAGPDDVPVLAAAAYDAGVRRALIAYKERRRRELARPLGRLLRAAVDAVLAPWADPARPFDPPPWSGVLLVPVPSSPAAQRRRGEDHVRRLATVAARPRGVRPVALLEVTGRRERRDAVDEVGLEARLAGAGRYRARAPTGAARAARRGGRRHRHQRRHRPRRRRRVAPRGVAGARGRRGRGHAPGRPATATRGVADAAGESGARGWPVRRGVRRGARRRVCVDATRAVDRP